MLNLCHLVDSPGHYARDCRSGAHHPDSGSYDRNDQQNEPYFPPDSSGDWAEPDSSTLAARMEMPEDKIRKILKIAKEPISMETPIGDDEDSHLGDFIEDTH